MSRKSLTLIILLAICGGLAGGILSGRASAIMPRVAAQELAPAQKWEYCAIADMDVYGSSDKAVGFVVIYYFKGTGYQAEKVEAAAERGVDAARIVADMARAKAIAKLGEDGWEMLCEGAPFATRARPAERDKALYFRRAKR